MIGNKLAVVFRYEFLKMVRTKAFLLTTLLGPFLIVAVTVLPSALALRSMEGAADSLRLGIYTSEAETARRVEALLGPSIAGRGWTYRVSSDEGELRALALGGTLDGYLKLPAGFPSGAFLPVSDGAPEPLGAEAAEGPSAFGWFSKGGADIAVSSAVESVVSAAVVSARLTDAGVDEAWARTLLAPVSLPTYRLEPGAGDTQTGELDFVATLLTGILFCMVIYMTVLLYGQQTGRSVVAEKSSKIVDILLSSARAEDILFGKIFGIGLAGLVQYAAWIGMTSVALALLGPAFGVSLPVSIGPDKFAWLVAFFAGGYLLYASFYASFGAASEDDQHMAQLSYPVILVLIVPMVLMQGIIQNPDSTLAVVLSFVPFTAPMVMMIRVLAGAAGPLEAGACLAILAASILGSGALSAKIFRTGLLMSGKNFSLRDIAGWLRA